MELYSLEDISGYTSINSDTLLSRAKTLGIKPFNKRSQTYLYTRAQAGCIIGNYTFTEPVEACELETIVSTEIFDGTELGFIADFAAAFVNQADFEELAYTINKDFE